MSILDTAVKKVLKDSEETVPLTVRLPKSVKEKLDLLSENNNISLNSIVQEIIKLSFEKEIEKNNVDKTEILRKYDELQKELHQYITTYDTDYTEICGYPVNKEFIPDELHRIKLLIDHIQLIEKAIKG